MSSIDVRPAPLVALGALALSSLVLVAWVRLNAPVAADDTAQHLPKQFAKHEDLWFSAEPDGSLRVQRADGALIARIASGEGGFVRATLRSLGGSLDGSMQHFRLALTERGQLLLIHPPSGRVLDLKAYGPSNRQSFSDLLIASESTP